MPKRVTFDTVKEIGLTLPNVVESTSYGASSLKINGQLLTCPAINKSAEPNSIVIRVTFDQRADLMAEAPDTYYVTDHYVNYPCVLVRMSRIERDTLRDLLRMSWNFVTTQKQKPARKKKAIR